MCVYGVFISISSVFTEPPLTPSRVWGPSCLFRSPGFSLRLLSSAPLVWEVPSTSQTITWTLASAQSAGSDPAPGRRVCKHGGVGGVCDNGHGDEEELARERASLSRQRPALWPASCGTLARLSPPQASRLHTQGQVTPSGRTHGFTLLRCAPWRPACSRASATGHS